MAYKKNRKRTKLNKRKFSNREKRAYWVGYGIGLANRKEDKSGYNNRGERFLETGRPSNIESANNGYRAAKKDAEYKILERFAPPEKK